MKQKQTTQSEAKENKSAQTAHTHTQYLGRFFNWTLLVWLYYVFILKSLMQMHLNNMRKSSWSEKKNCISKLGGFIQRSYEYMDAFVHILAGYTVCFDDYPTILHTYSRTEDIEFIPRCKRRRKTNIITVLLSITDYAQNNCSMNWSIECSMQYTAIVQQQKRRADMDDRERPTKWNRSGVHALLLVHRVCALSICNNGRYFISHISSGVVQSHFLFSHTIFCGMILSCFLCKLSVFFSPSDWLSQYVHEPYGADQQTHTWNEWRHKIKYTHERRKKKSAHNASKIYSDEVGKKCTNKYCMHTGFEAQMLDNE